LSLVRDAFVHVFHTKTSGLHIELINGLNGQHI